MDAKIKQQLDEKTHAALEHLGVEMAGVRTGRASLILFESIMVNCYGSKMPLKQVASLAVPEARLVTIQPWDISQIGEIEKAILSSNIGLTPTNDGKIIRVAIPALTEEKRKDLVKLVKKLGEECKVTIRNTRREIIDELKKLQKEGTLSEDLFRKSQDEAQKMTDQTISKVDEMIAKKETEVLQV
jgi:ribosome recycling factor